MANWNSPTVSTAYVTVLAELKDRDVDAATLSGGGSNIPTGTIKYNRTEDRFQEWNGAAWIDALIGVLGGGTGGNTAADARTGLGLGTIATQNSNAVTITGGSITGLSALTSSGDITAPNLIGEVQLGNNQYVKGKTTGAVSRGIFTLDNNNIIKLGNANHDLQFVSAITSVLDVGKAGQTGQVLIKGDNAILDFRELDAAANAKYWRHVVIGSEYRFQMINDAFDNFNNILIFTRNGMDGNWNSEYPFFFNSPITYFTDGLYVSKVGTPNNPKTRLNLDVSGTPSGKLQATNDLGNIPLKINTDGGVVYIGGSMEAVLITGNQLLTENGVLGAPSHSFSNDDDSGIYSPAPDVVSIVTNGSNSGGNVASEVVFGSSDALSSYFNVVINGTIRLRVRTNGVEVDTDLFPGTDNVRKCGKVDNRWTEVWATNGTIQTSDGNLKNEIGPAVGLNFINTLRPISYNWKHTPGKVRQGFIAQEMLALWKPYDVLRDEQPELLGLNYTELIAPIVKSIQELYGLLQERCKN